jgi:putative membrane protein
MRGLVVRWLVCAVALYLTDLIVPGIQIESISALLFAAAAIGVLNAIVRPVILFVTLPLNILTLGLFTLVINAAMLKLASDVVRGFDVSGLLAAFEGWLLLSFFTFIINVLIGEHGTIEVIAFRHT